MPAQSDLYAQYRASLTALEDVPDQITRGFDAARRSQESAQSTATSDFEQNSIRLSRLRHTAQTRYGAAVDALEERGAKLPALVRPVSGVAGDEKSLRQALDAQAKAAAAVNVSVTGTSAQQAADALRARQDKARRDRKTSEQTAAHKRRLLFGLIGGASAAALMITAFVILISINQ